MPALTRHIVFLCCPDGSYLLPELDHLLRNKEKIKAFLGPQKVSTLTKTATVVAPEILVSEVTAPEVTAPEVAASTDATLAVAVPAATSAETTILNFLNTSSEGRPDVWLFKIKNKANSPAEMKLQVENEVKAKVQEIYQALEDLGLPLPPPLDRKEIHFWTGAETTASEWIRWAGEWNKWAIEQCSGAWLSWVGSLLTKIGPGYSERPRLLQGLELREIDVVIREQAATPADRFIDQCINYVGKAIAVVMTVGLAAIFIAAPAATVWGTILLIVVFYIHCGGNFKKQLLDAINRLQALHVPLKDLKCSILCEFAIASKEKAPAQLLFRLLRAGKVIFSALSGFYANSIHRTSLYVRVISAFLLASVFIAAMIQGAHHYSLALKVLEPASSVWLWPLAGLYAGASVFSFAFLFYSWLVVLGFNRQLFKPAEILGDPLQNNGRIQKLGEIVSAAKKMKKVDDGKQSLDEAKRHSDPVRRKNVPQVRPRSPSDPELFVRNDFKASEGKISADEQPAASDGVNRAEGINMSI